MTMVNMQKVFDTFGYGEMAGLAEGVLNRIEADDLKDDPYEAVWQAMDDELIYTADQWTMIQYYCTPQNADYDNAWEEFQNDLMTCIRDGVFKKGEEEA